MLHSVPSPLSTLCLTSELFTIQIIIICCYLNKRKIQHLLRRRQLLIIYDYLKIMNISPHTLHTVQLSLISNHVILNLQTNLNK